MTGVEAINNLAGAIKAEVMPTKIELPKGVMFNAYPDSIGRNLADIVYLLKRPELKDVFSLFYILPTVFNSDLDRGFSIINYDLNDDLVSRGELEELHGTPRRTLFAK